MYMYTTSQPVLERDQNYRARNESVSVRGHDPYQTGAPELSLPGPRWLPRGTLQSVDHYLISRLNKAP